MPPYKASKSQRCSHVTAFTLLQASTALSAAKSRPLTALQVNKPSSGQLQVSSTSDEYCLHAIRVISGISCALSPSGWSLKRKPQACGISYTHPTHPVLFCPTLPTPLHLLVPRLCNPCRPKKGIIFLLSSFCCLLTPYILQLIPYN